MKSTEDPSWKLYTETLLRFWLPESFIVDLRQQVINREKAEFVRAGLRASFAILTAYNPRGCSTDDRTNTRKTAELEQDLRARDIVVLAADGMSTDGCHAEPGFAVALKLDEATSIARHYEQSAFFWFDGERFWIMPALVQAEPVLLPLPMSGWEENHWRK